MTVENTSLSIVNSVINYIEQNVKYKYTLEDIANHANISMYHLHRIFKALTDKKLMNYVMGRKLASSISELLNSNLRIIDIANEYGFEYEQSYIRAFIREYGISPDEFRKKGSQLQITDKIDLNNVKTIGIDGILFEPRILIKPGFYISGLRHFINSEENHKTFELTNMANDFFYNHINKIKNIKNPAVYIGLIEHIPNNEAFRYYTTSLEVTGGIKTQEGIYNKFVPTHKYAVFKYIGMHHPSQTTIKNLLGVHYFAGKWICNSNYLVADKFRFERVNLGIARDDYCEVEIFIPITDKKSDINFDYSWILKLFTEYSPLGQD